MGETPRPARHVRRLIGELTRDNYDRFSEIVFEEINGVIALDLMIEETPESSADAPERFSVAHEGGQLTTYKVGDEGGFEILINGGLSRQWAMWRADGFYLIKSGGMQQGFCSVGLIETDEALIRLNPAVKVITIRLGNTDD